MTQTKPQETIKHCHLCGKELVLYYAGETDKFKFCTNKHKSEWHNIFPLSDARLTVLEMLEYDQAELPYSNTVYVMSDMNSGRDIPMIRCLNPEQLRKIFEITEFGKKVLDTYREMLYTE